MPQGDQRANPLQGVHHRTDAVPEPQVLPRHDARGALATPGLVDCHTHLVYGGQRAREFELRLQGASYEEIARAGGGIVSTVRQTREAVPSDLMAQSARRLAELMAHGVTTVEIKSGYGLSLKDELKCLRVARELGQHHPVTVRTTLLAAHALPPEYAGRADDYIVAAGRRISSQVGRRPRGNGRQADRNEPVCHRGAQPRIE